MKRIIKEYLRFTRRERVAVILLVLLMGVFIALPYYYEPVFEVPVADSALGVFVATAEDKAGVPYNGIAALSSSENNRSPALVHFDPNTITESGWQQLGISARLASTIVKYRSKGGRFRNAEDLKKIWGMKPEMAARLMPYVTVKEEAPAPYYKREIFPGRAAVAEKTIPVIDVNLAQQADWKSLPGIGEVLAARIMRYRDKCGGFSSVEAVGATYGIADSVFVTLQPFLRFDARNLPKTDLNQAGIVQLKNRLQLSYAQAKILVRYREEHGPFTSLDQLKLVPGLPDTVSGRLAGLVRLQ